MRRRPGGFPPAVSFLPKRSGVKVYRYKTKEGEGFREALAFTPKTVEGYLYEQNKQHNVPETEEGRMIS